MGRQGGGRAPVGIGIAGGVLAVVVAGVCAVQTVRLRGPAGAFGAAARGDAASSSTIAPARTAPPAALTPDVLFARAAPAVVRINVSNGAMKPIGYGSGFFVTGDGLLVTNYHVIDGANYATVERTDGTVLRVDGVAAADANNDLVLLKVTPADGRAVPTLDVAGDVAPRVGTTVYAIGNPLGLKNVLSEGLVSGLGDESQGQHFIQTTAAISPGSSGGPLMTADGAVVGVTAATARDAQNLNFAIPAAQVRALLRRPRPQIPTPLLPRGVTPRAPRQSSSSPSLPSRPPPPQEAAPASDAEVDRVWDSIRAERYNESIRQLEQLRERGENSAYYWFTWGSVHTRLHNDELAAEAFRKSLELKPDKVATHLNLGQTYARLGQLDQAVATFETAAKLAPRDPRPFSEAGEAYAKAKQFERAIPFYKSALQRDPSNSRHHGDLGVAYSRLERYDEALACFRRCAELEPAVAKHHRHIGITLFRLARHGDAVQALQTSLALKPDSAESYLYLGYAQLALGNRRAALDAWANADRFDPPGGQTGRLARGAIDRVQLNQAPPPPPRD